eukprot:3910622-Alexandrium_andersonii.AAC.1
MVSCCAFSAGAWESLDSGCAGQRQGFKQGRERDVQIDITRTIQRQRWRPRRIKHNETDPDQQKERQ